MGKTNTQKLIVTQEKLVKTILSSVKEISKSPWSGREFKMEARFGCSMPENSLTTIIDEFELFTCELAVPSPNLNVEFPALGSGHNHHWEQSISLLSTYCLL